MKDPVAFVSSDERGLLLARFAATDSIDEPHGVMTRDSLPMLTVGDTVHLRHLGLATVVRMDEIEWAGDRSEYFVLQLLSDQSTRYVPVDKPSHLGIRPAISSDEADEVLAQLGPSAVIPSQANWSKWYWEMRKAVDSGEFQRVAHAVRDIRAERHKPGQSEWMSEMCDPPQYSAAAPLTIP
jgi:RNA polymerase-interacting CarD/CdnL/TRCF family regulator